jgi:hypothetical protein
MYIILKQAGFRELLKKVFRFNKIVKPLFTDLVLVVSKFTTHGV